jgi:hypothetical protein
MSNVDKDMLSRELHSRSQDVGGHPIDLDTVRSTAGRIRRRRNVVGLAVAALVAAVVVPAGLAVTDLLSTAGAPDEMPSFAGSPSMTQAPRPTGPVRLTVDGLERGDDAGVAYVYGKELFLPDGRVVRLERTYQEIAPVGDGWVGVTSGDGGAVTRDLIDPQGNITSTLPSAGGLATDLDGSRVAWTQIENGEVNLVDVTTDGMEPRSPANQGNPPMTPVGYAGEGVLVYTVGAEQTEVRVFEPSASDYEIPARPRLIAARGTAENEGLVAGQTESRIDGSCWAVVSYRTGDPAFETCDHSLRAFSRDGRYVIGTDAYTDGAGLRSLAVLDARSGTVVARFVQPRNGQLYLGEPVWEDDEHVLAPVVDGLETQVVRFGLDGTIEVASDTVTADGYFMPSPIRFVTQP